jgi:hypothetical protein
MAGTVETRFVVGAIEADEGTTGALDVRNELCDGCDRVLSGFPADRLD